MTTDQNYNAPWSLDSFHDLFNEYYQSLVVYAFRFVQDEASAEDIVVDVFSYLWDHQPDISTDAVIRTYLYNAVRNNSLKWLRSQHYSTTSIDELENGYPVFSVDNEEMMVKEKTLRLVMKAIDELPERQRKVLLLAIEGYKNKEIAEQLNLSIDTVKTHRKRALSVLRKKLLGVEFMILLALLSNSWNIPLKNIQFLVS